MKQQTKFKETEIGEIPEDWETERLGDLAEIVRGVSYRSEDYCLEEEGLAFINLKCVERKGGFRKDGIKYYKGKVKQNQFISEGDILIANTDLTQNREVIGAPILVPALGRQSCFSLDLTKLLSNNQIEKKFFYYYLLSPPARNFMINSGNGTTVVHLSVSNVPNLLVPLPPLPEQRVIAKILSDLDAKIELIRQMNTTLEKMAEVLFKHWFVDFEFPDEHGRPYKSSGGKMIESELGEIPEGWEVKELRNCGEIVCGKTPPTSDKDNYGHDYLFVTIPDMRDNTFVIKTEKKLSKVGAETQKKKELPPLSVCVSCIATPGLISLTSEESHTNQQINSIICNSLISPYYMYLAMKLKGEEIRTMGLGGTATLNLNTGDFSRIKLLMPSQKIMLRFHEMATTTFNLISNNQRENETLNQTRDSLLPKLMSGRIRVT